MTADLITRIILDDSKFNDTLNKVRKGLDFTGSVTKGITSSLKGMAGQIAAAAGAYEIMNTAVNSNSVTQESWNDILGTAKESVDNFFTSLSTGDWSVWEKGVTHAITLGQKYTEALRNMRMAILVGDVRLSTQEKDLNLYENQASDVNASAADREKAFVKFKAMGQETIAYVDNLSKYVNGRLSDMLAGKGIQADKNVRDMVFKYLDPSTDGARMLEEYTILRNQIRATETQANAIATDAFGAQAKASAAEKLPALRKQMSELVSMYPELKKAFDLKANFGTQEELDQLFDIIDKIVGYEDRLESAKRQIRDVAKDFDKNGKLIATTAGAGAGKGNPLIPEGSIADLEKQIANARTNLRMAVDPESRVKLENEIRALENEKHVIEFEYKHPNGPKKVERNSGGLAALAGIPDMTEPIEKIFSSKKTKDISKYADSIQMVADSVGGLSRNFSSGASAGLQYFANVVSGAAQAAIAIAALIPIKEAESQANAKAAITGAAASQAAIPLVGPFLAMAAVASLIAVMLSIPKFARGGIVPGTSFSGDRVPAFLNSGEMVLNAGQQSRLFNMINSGVGGTTNGGKVEFKIRGKDLVGVISQYSNQRNKIL